MPLNLQINSTYTFSTLAPAILGAVIKNAKLEMSCGFETAMKFENVVVKYQQVYPALPPGAPITPVDVIFYRFITESGERILIAEPWIDSNSVVGVVHLNFTINIVNATNADKNNIRLALAHLGVNFSME